MYQSIKEYGKGSQQYLPLGLYSFRWDIEVSYYEGKTYWSLDSYMLRSRKGIERLVNLISISYSAMTLIPYKDESFSRYRSDSAQETRFKIGQQIQAFIILTGFGKKLETLKNGMALINLIESYIQSGFQKIKNL